MSFPSNEVRNQMLVMTVEIFGKRGAEECVQSKEEVDG